MGVYGHPKDIYPRSHACSAKVNQKGSEGGAKKHRGVMEVNPAEV